VATDGTAPNRLFRNSLWLTGILRSSFLKNTAIYAGSTMVNSAIPFLLLPVLTRFMSPEDFGIAAMFTMTATVLQTLILFNANGAVVAMFYRVGPDQARQLSKAGFFLMSLVACAALAVTCAMDLLFPEVLMMSLPWVIACVALASVNAAFSFGLKIYQMQEKASSFATFQVSLAALSAALTVWLVVGEGLGWRGRATAWLASSLICGAIVTIQMIRQGWVRFNFIPSKTELRPVLDYSLPLMPHSMATLFSSMTDRVYIGLLTSAAALGIYSVGSQLAMVVTVGFGAFNLTFSPWLFRKLSTNNTNDIADARRATTWTCITLMLVAISLSIVIPVILPFITGARFAAAREVAPILFLASALDAMAKTQQHYLAFTRKTGSISRITLAGLAVSAAIMAVFVPLFGEKGAAWCLVASNLAIFFMSWFSAQKAITRTLMPLTPTQS
jgi:O-antigen/teichoic acid export membrane protein